MSNFGFLQAEWPELHAEAVHAERVAIADPRAACFYARRVLELALTWLYDADETLKRPYKRDLSAMIAEPTLVAQVGPALRAKMQVIRRHGNWAVHRSGPVSANDSEGVVEELFHVMYWIGRTYSQDPVNRPDAGVAFNRAVIPRPPSADVRLAKRAELAATAAKYAAQDAELAKLRKANASLDAQIVLLRAAKKVAKAANRLLPDDHDYNEVQTRTLQIDGLLKEAGWPLADTRDREFPVTGMPNKSGKGWVDYVLWDDDGLPLAVVEAKKASSRPTVAQRQAELYANCLEAQFGQRPIIFYTNGFETQIWDDQNYPPRPVMGFYTKHELRLLIQRRTGRVSMAVLPITTAIADRSYQERAIRLVAEAFEDKKQRHALLVMATGSGKTRMVIALVDLMLRAKRVKNVLFLADRKTLVSQAVKAFRRHLPSVPAVNLVEEKNSASRVFVSTYPTMLNLANDVDDKDIRRFGPGFFDLIIIDEAHRSIYQRYGVLFEYFDALVIGLTATPKNEIDRNTYRRFELEDGVPTDAYPLDEAVGDGWLVPPRGKDVPLKFQRDGITYADLSDDDKEQWDELEWDDDGAVPAVVPPADMNKFLFNKDTTDKILTTLMTEGIQVGDRLGKTIIFAANNDHADFIKARFDVNYPELGGTFARVITYKTVYAQNLIDQFSEMDKEPRIAISVDMLDTGVDVPEVVNLLFYKLVRSKTKFWQMLGRGTRLAPDLFGPGRDKKEFFVFDVCQNLEFFNMDLEAPEGTLAAPLSEQLFHRRADLLLALDVQRKGPHPPVEAGADGTVSVTGLRWDLAHRLHDEVAGMDQRNILVRREWEQVKAFQEFARWLKLTPELHAEVVDHVAGLPTSFRDDDASVEAKNFDLLALRLQLSLIHVEPGYAAWQARMQEIASALLDKLTLAPVAAQRELLLQVAGDEWWQDVTLTMLETVRRRLRSLVKLIDKAKRRLVYSDFEDELGPLSDVTITASAVGVDLTRFNQKLRAYLNDHTDHLAVQKLRRNRQITLTDLEELERIFLELGIGTTAEIEQAKASSGGLGLFIRSIIGVEKDSVHKEFARFHQGNTYTSVQLDFVNMLVDHIAHNGRIDADVMYAPPFTAIAPRGPETIFTTADIQSMVSAMNAVNSTARPA